VRHKETLQLLFLILGRFDDDKLADIQNAIGVKIKPYQKLEAYDS
jgi:hypothetical protein